MNFDNWKECDDPAELRNIIRHLMIEMYDACKARGIKLRDGQLPIHGLNARIMELESKVEELEIRLEDYVFADMNESKMGIRGEPQ